MDESLPVPEHRSNPVKLVNRVAYAVGVWTDPECVGDRQITWVARALRAFDPTNAALRPLVQVRWVGGIGRRPGAR